MDTFWERATHSVNHMLSLLCLFVVLVVLPLGFEGGNFGLIALVAGHCWPFFILILTIDKQMSQNTDNIENSSIFDPHCSIEGFSFVPPVCCD